MEVIDTKIVGELGQNPNLNKKNKLIDRITENYIPYLFISPWLILFLVFTAYPIVFSIYVSMTDFSMLNPSSLKDFVGLSNYIELFTDSNFHTVLINTLLFAVVTIPITTVLAMLLAVALNQGVKFKSLFRIGFFFPAVTSMAVTAILFKLIFHKEGIFTEFVQFLGFEGRNWLLDQYTALPCIMLMSIWAAVGYYMVIYLSSLQSIPSDLYEAATVDGAKPLQKFFYITLPYLRHTTIFVVVVNTINSLQIFTEPYVMTQGGPVYATTTGVLYLYRMAFTSQRMGYASAVGYALFVIILIFTVIQMKVLKLNKGVDD